MNFSFEFRGHFWRTFHPGGGRTKIFPIVGSIDCSAHLFLGRILVVVVVDIDADKRHIYQINIIETPP